MGTIWENFELGLKSALGIFFCKALYRRYFDSALNMLLVLNMLGLCIFFSRNIRKFRFLKYQTFFLGGFYFFELELKSGLGGSFAKLGTVDVLLVF